MSADLSDRQSKQPKNLTPSDKRRFLDELRKLSKNGAVKYADVKKGFDMMIVDRRKSETYRINIRKASRKVCA